MLLTSSKQQKLLLLGVFIIALVSTFLGYSNLLRDRESATTPAAPTITTVRGSNSTTQFWARGQGRDVEPDTFVELHLSASALMSPPPSARPLPPSPPLHSPSPSAAAAAPDAASAAAAATAAPAAATASLTYCFRHLLFRGHYTIMAGIGSRACRLHVPARIL